MKQKHYNLIAHYREKLKEVYTVEVEYDQKVTGMYAHYNRIIIMLKKGYREYDFWHEFLHLEFLTQEIRIKYLYPKREYYEEKDLFLLSNILVNIIYDMYVDAAMARGKKAPSEYFKKKIEEYQLYMNRFDEYYDIPLQYSEIIKKSICEYLNALEYIISGQIMQSEYLKDNSILLQRKQIDSYLNEADLLDRYEWITYHTLYLREQEENGDRG